MIFSHGDFLNAFALEVWAGDVPAEEVWVGDEKVYPDERTEVRDIALDEPDGHYWLHALDAAKAGVAYMVMTLGGRDYHLYHGDGTLPILQSVNGCFRADSYAGILLSDCLGATVTVRASVPQRTSQQAMNGKLVLDVPWIPGTKMVGRWSKGQKRRWAGVQVKATGLPSGTVHCGGSCETSEHKRGWKHHLMPDDGHKWYNPVWRDELVEGDTRLELWCNGIGSSGDSGRLEAIFPAFEREWRLRVLGVTLQHNK